jgi:hypothetical protein
VIFTVPGNCWMPGILSLCEEVVMYNKRQSLRVFRNAGLILIILLVLLPLNTQITIAQPSTIFTVNTNSTEPDTAPGNGICATVSGFCSLRAAIQEVNANVPGNDTINFSGNFTIGEAFSYVITANYVHITGSGHTIVLDGTGLASDNPIMSLFGNGGTIDTLTIQNSPSMGIQIGNTNNGNNYTLEYLTLINNAVSGIEIIGNLVHTSGSGNIIRYNNIGTGNPSDPCAVDNGNGYGIGIQSYAYNTTIFDNDIVCNHYEGISIFSSSTGSISFNNISGNYSDGILFNSSDSFTVSANYIGNMEGDIPLCNSRDGIRLLDGTHDITIGGDSSEDSNIISNNIKSGVYIFSGVYAIDIDRNYIGLSSSGLAMGNGEAGIAIRSSTDIDIGNAYADKPQYISNNYHEGVYIADSSEIDIGYSNYIGVGTSGEIMGNDWEGIYVDGGTTDTTIYAHSILYNHRAGIGLADFTTTYGIVTLPTDIYSNGGLPIDLRNDGPTPNDSGDTDTGPNRVLNYPVITGLVGGNLTGTTCSFCWVYFYAAAFTFKNEVFDGGAWMVPPGSVQANGSGTWSIPYPISGHHAWNMRLITCQDEDGYHASCSEMTPRYNTFLPILKK